MFYIVNYGHLTLYTRRFLVDSKLNVEQTSMKISMREKLHVDISEPGH